MLAFCHGSEEFSDKTAEEQLNSFISSLRDEFQEPPDAKCRRLAAELSAMKQDPSESVDEFAFQYKNTLHQLGKLGESLTKSFFFFLIYLLIITKLQHKENKQKKVQRKYSSTT